MSAPIEGNLSAKGRRFGIVAARTNDLVVARLLDGALDAFHRHGAGEEDVVVVRTPGAWELPLALRDLARVGRFDALVALGAVIRGGRRISSTSPPRSPRASFRSRWRRTFRSRSAS